MIRNEGEATTKEIARLLYIFEYRYPLSHYEKIAEDFALNLLQEYNIVKCENGKYMMLSWPISESETKEIASICHKKSNGFFKNLNQNRKEVKIDN
jgi:hypothetical protein